MKNFPSITLNVAYWFICLVMMSFVYNAVNYPSMIFFPVMPDPEVFSTFGALILIPSLLSFYTGYFYFFRGFLMKRKYSLLVIAMITLSLACAGLVLLPSTFLMSNGHPRYWSLPLYGLHFVVLSLIHCSAGLVIKGFVTWLDSRSEASQVPANSI